MRCAGPRSTVANTKTVVFLQRGLSFGNLDLAGGLPAPKIVFHAFRGARHDPVFDATAGELRVPVPAFAVSPGTGSRRSAPDRAVRTDQPPATVHNWMRCGALATPRSISVSGTSCAW